MDSLTFRTILKASTQSSGGECRKTESVSLTCPRDLLNGPALYPTAPIGKAEFYACVLFLGSELMS